MSLQNKFDNLPATDMFINELNVSQRIKRALSNQWKSLNEEMRSFKFSDESKEFNESMDLQKSSSAILNLVVTSWRSGSTFIGELLTTHPGTFYHYEPFEPIRIKQIRKNDGKYLKLMKNLFKCDYLAENLDEYLQFFSKNIGPFEYYFRYWRSCNSARNNFLCFHPKYIQNACRLFPFQVMKTVRLRMNLIEPLLKDESLNLKVVLLVRDPRGMYESRMRRDFCPGNPDCDDPFHFCTDMMSDYYGAKSFSKKYPGRIKVIRYEDFAVDVYNQTKLLFEFFDLEYSNSIVKYLNDHSVEDIGDVWSTFRNSKKAPFNWRSKLKSEKVFEIQSACEYTMKLFGYKLLRQNEKLISFEPVGNFTF